MLHPSRVKGPALVMTALAAAFFGISRTSGSGWATVLVATLLGAVATGSLVPALILARAKVTVTPPIDGTVAVPLPMQITSTTGLTGNIPALATGTIRLATGTLSVRPERRGVHDSLDMELRCAAPLGMVEWTKTRRITLAAPLEIGPSPSDVQLLDSDTTPFVGEGDLRGVREYIPGDSSRKLHWPATARTGKMMIRETDGITVAPVVIVVDLNGPQAAVEPTASRVAGLANAALSRGATVVLVTAEPAGPVTGMVTTPLDVNRRLARAIVGPVPTADRLRL